MSSESNKQKSDKVIKKSMNEIKESTRNHNKLQSQRRAFIAYSQAAANPIIKEALASKNFHKSSVNLNNQYPSMHKIGHHSKKTPVGGGRKLRKHKKTKKSGK